MGRSDFRFFLIIILAIALFAGDPDIVDSAGEFLRNYNSCTHK